MRSLWLLQKPALNLMAPIKELYAPSHTHLYMYILNLRSYNPTPSDRRNQPFVEPSLEFVQINVTFTAQGGQRVLLPFKDDEVGRENTERVVLSLSALTFPGRVDFSPHGEIEVGVSDDDSEWMKADCKNNSCIFLYYYTNEWQSRTHVCQLYFTWSPRYAGTFWQATSYC